MMAPKPGPGVDPPTPKPGKPVDQLTYTAYANPYLLCVTCNERAVGRLDDKTVATWPCGDAGDVVSICPTWGPVDGCVCLETYGYIPHGLPSESVRDRRKPDQKPPPKDPPPDPVPAPAPTPDPVPEPLPPIEF